MANESRNKRLLCLKKIFEEETDAEHGLSMPEILKHLHAYGIDADRRTIYEDVRVLQDMEKMDIDHGEGERIYRLRSRMFSIAELKLIVDSMASSKVLSAETTNELTEKLESLCSKYERIYLRKTGGRRLAKSFSTQISWES